MARIHDNLTFIDRARRDKAILSREHRSQRHEIVKEIEDDEEPNKDDEELTKDDEELSKDEEEPTIYEDEPIDVDEEPSKDDETINDEEPSGVIDEYCLDTNTALPSKVELVETKQTLVVILVLSVHRMPRLSKEICEDQYLADSKDLRTNPFQEGENDANLNNPHHGSLDIGEDLRTNLFQGGENDVNLNNPHNGSGAWKEGLKASKLGLVRRVRKRAKRWKQRWKLSISDDPSDRWVRMQREPSGHLCSLPRGPKRPNVR